MYNFLDYLSNGNLANVFANLLKCVCVNVSLYGYVSVGREGPEKRCDSYINHKKTSDMLLIVM